jgi:hypothetical protein
MALCHSRLDAGSQASSDSEAARREATAISHSRHMLAETDAWHRATQDACLTRDSDASSCSLDIIPSSDAETFFAKSMTTLPCPSLTIPAATRDPAENKRQEAIIKTKQIIETERHKSSPADSIKSRRLATIFVQVARHSPQVQYNQAATSMRHLTSCAGPLIPVSQKPPELLRVHHNRSTLYVTP